MAIGITLTEQTQVSQLYVALFGRAPLNTGLGYWASELVAGTSLTTVANQMYATPPARAYYPAAATNADIVTSFFLNVLGRPVAADGLLYWTGQLNLTNATPGSVINDMIYSTTHFVAGGTDPVFDAAGVKAAALFANKTAVAVHFGLSTSTSLTLAQNALVGVDETLASVTTVEAANDAAIAGASGTPFTLTTGVNALTGTTGNDTFDGSLVSGVTTLGSADNLNGGGGTADTLTATIATTALIQPTLTSIENVSLTSATGGTAANVSLLNATGITTLEATGSSTAFVFTNISSPSVALKVSGQGQDVNFGFAAASVVGTADTANLTLNSVTAGTITVAGVETLNVHSNGSANALTALTLADATKVVVDGSQNLNLGAALGTPLATLDASAATGMVTAELTKGAVTIRGGTGNDTFTVSITGGDVSIAAGAGDDSITFAGSATLTIADTVDGGTGANTLHALSANVNALTTANHITNIQTVSLTDTRGTVAIDLTTVGSAVTQLINENTVGVDTTTFNAGASTIRFNNATFDNQTFNTAVANTATTDALTMLVKADLSNAKTITTTGIETLTISDSTADETYGTIAMTASTGGTATLNFSGSKTVTAGVITADVISAAGLTGTVGTQLTMVTGQNTATSITGSAGNDVLFGAITTGKSQYIDGGAGNDNITAGAGNDTILGGAGQDTITSGAGNDSISGGDGNDTIIMGSNLSANDTIDGGTGTNTLSVTTMADAGAFANVSNIQNVSISGNTQAVSLYSPFSTAATFTLAGTADTLSLLTGYTGATTVDVTGANGGGGGLKDLVVNSANVALTVTGNVADFTTGAGATTLTGGTGTDTLILTADNGTADLSGVTKFETLTILANATTPSKTATITGMVAATGTTITVNASNLTDSAAALSFTSGTSAGKFSVTGGAAGDTIDLGTNPVAVGSTVVSGAGDDIITAGAGNDSIDAGAGNDTINMGTSRLNASDTIDGGSGTADVLTATFATTGLTATTGVLHIANVETIKLANNVVGTIDATNITGANLIAIDGGSGITITGLANGATIGLGGGATSTSTVFTGTGNFALASTTGSTDSLNLKLNAITNAQTVGAITTAGIETVNVTAGVVLGGTQILDLSLSTAATINLTASATNGNTQAISLGTLNTATTLVDASANASSGTFTVTTANTVGATIKASQGANLIAGNATGQDTIYVATGFDANDSINGGTSTADVLNATIDTVSAGLTTLNLSNVTNIETMSVNVAATAAATALSVTTVGALSDAALKSFTLTGTNPTHTFSVVGSQVIADSASNALTTFDASGFAGVVDVRLSGKTTGIFMTGSTIKGGSGSLDVAHMTNAGVTLTKPTMSGFEQLEIYATGTAVADLTNTTGLSKVTLDGTANNSVTGLAAGVSVDLGKASTLANNLGTVFTDGATYNVSLASTTGSADALTVGLNDQNSAATAAILTVDGVENLTLVAVDAAKSFMLNVTETANTKAQTITVTGGYTTTPGQQSVTLTAVNQYVTSITNSSTDNLIMADASRAGTAAMSITGGTGNDTIILKNIADSIDAGTGTDTLKLVYDSIGGQAIIDLSSTVDQMTYLDGIASTAVQLGFENADASGYTGTFGVRITAATAGSTITGSSQVDVLTGGAGNDTFNYATSALFTSTGGGTGAVVDSIAGNGGTADQVVITGAITIATGDSLARATTVEKLVAGTSAAVRTETITIDSNAHLSGFNTIDLSGDTGTTSTGNIVLTGVTVATTLTGVAVGANTITGGTGNDTITAGAGTDLITGAAGTDTINLGAAGAVDTLKYAEAGATNVDTVSNSGANIFTVGTDIVSMTSGTFATSNDALTAMGGADVGVLAAGAFASVAVAAGASAALADATNLIVFSSTASTSFATAIGAAVLTATTGTNTAALGANKGVAAVWYDATNTQAVYGYILDSNVPGTALTSLDTFVEVVRIGMASGTFLQTGLDSSLSSF